MTDVEGEVNGLVTYDREVVKVDVDRLHEVNRRLVRSLDLEAGEDGKIRGVSAPCSVRSQCIPRSVSNRFDVAGRYIKLLPPAQPATSPERPVLFAARGEP